MDCATVIKRGYLYDKKVGLLPVAVDRKRWYILRQDLAQGYCVLEYYKDEKTASKGEAPKGFINVHDVVEVKRVTDKKQTFGILCPGVGYRLMANSEAEADDWTAALQKLTLYRKDNTKSLSLQRVPSSPAHLHSLADQRHRTLSDSSHAHTHPNSLEIPTPNHMHTHIPTDGFLSQSPSVNLSHSLPTPPESIAFPPMPIFQPPPIQRQKSAECVPSLPSPSTSSDSSSMCSGPGSNASFDAQSVFDGDGETKFRVHVKEADNLSITGPADLIVTDEGIALHSIQTGHVIASWPIGALRKYGVNNVCFTILTGRFCSTGEGRFQFYTPHSRLIHSRVHGIATQKAGAANGKPIPRRSSEPGAGSTHSVGNSLPLLQSTSPPSVVQYTHIQHSVVPSTSQEQYSKLGTQTSTGVHGPAQDYSKLQHFTGTSSLPHNMSPSFTTTQSVVQPISTIAATVPQPLLQHHHQHTCTHHHCTHCCAPQNVVNTTCVPHPLNQTGSTHHLHNSMTGQTVYLSTSPNSSQSTSNLKNMANSGQCISSHSVMTSYGGAPPLPHRETLQSNV